MPRGCSIFLDTRAAPLLPAPKPILFMLIKLFGSKSRVSILKLFLLNPNDKFYVRQLSRRLGLQVNSASRELDNLENLGLLASNLEIVNCLPEAEEAGEEKPKGIDAVSKKEKPASGRGFASQQRKYYRVNQDFVLLDEIKNLIVRSQILYEKDFAEKIKNIGAVKLLILTGVFAGNDKSPVDVLAVGKINKARFLATLKEMEKELERELNYTIMDPGEFKYRKDITDVFLYNILEGKKMIIIDEIGIL